MKSLYIVEFIEYHYIVGIYKSYENAEACREQFIEKWKDLYGENCLRIQVVDTDLFD